MITSENMVFETQFKSFFNFMEESCSVPEIYFLYFKTIPSTLKVVNKGSVHFWIYTAQKMNFSIKDFVSKETLFKLHFLCSDVFWIVNYLIIKRGELINIAMRNVFRKYFAWFRGLGPKSGSFFICQPTEINPISCHWSVSVFPENIRKPDFFWYFQGV